MPLTYQEALDYLFPRTTRIKFGLETTRRLLAGVGEPHRLFPTIHVAGTNGKGSVAALIAGTLQASGWKVGLYTSPHLVSFRERIQVNGVPISEGAVAAWTAQLHSLIEETGATFFEISTAIAFADFASREVDIAVIEVGLGGRLDSTNVIVPLAAVITHIALDHQKYLGETTRDIAREKAGIAKPAVPLVIGEPDPEVVSVLLESGKTAVESLDPDGCFLPVVVPPGAVYPGPLGLQGLHQRRNAAIAATLLDLLPAPFRPDAKVMAGAFARARVSGRFDRRGRWLFDVAHNPDGMRALTAALRGLEPPRPIRALVSILGDKAYPEMLVELDQAIDFRILTVAPTATGRRWDTGWLERWLAEPGRPPARAKWRLEPDFWQALRAVESGEGTILVTGSFHTVGDVMTAKGFEVG